MSARKVVTDKFQDIFIIDSITGHCNHPNKLQLQLTRNPQPHMNISTTKISRARSVPTIFAALAATFLFSSVSLQAQTWAWTGNDDTIFSNADNWDQATAPVAGNAVSFALGGTYTVELIKAESVGVLTLRGTTAADITFDMDGNTLTFEGGSSTWQRGPAGEARTVTLLNGGLTVSSSGSNTNLFSTGNSPSNVGDATFVIGLGGVFLSNRDLNVGAGSTHDDPVESTLRIINGGIMQMGDQRLRISSVASDLTQTIEIDGLGSRMTSTASHQSRAVMVFGAANGTTTHTTVTNGGAITTTSSASISVALDAGSTSTINVSGSVFNPITEQTEYSFVGANRIFIGGGRNLNNNDPLAGGNGTIAFTNGGSGEFQQMLVFNNAAPGDYGTLAIDGGMVTISDELTFDAGAVLRYTLNDGPAGFTPGIFVTNGNEDASMTISGALLELFVGAGFEPVLNETYLLASYDILTGTFADLAEGATVAALNSPHLFTISYIDGIDGNAIGLTTVAIPEPHHAAVLMLLAAAMMVILRRRK